MRLQDKKIVLALGLLFLFVMAIPAVRADFFDDLFGDINVDWGLGYARYSSFIDGILIFLIFFGLSKFALRDRFKGGGALISIGVSLALSFSATYFMYTNDFNLGLLGPYALLIIMVVFFFLLFNLVKGIGASPWLAFAIVFFFLSFLAEAVFKHLPSGWYTAFNFCKIIAIIIFVVSLFKLFKGKKFPGIKQAIQNMKTGEGAADSDEKRKERDLRKKENQLNDDIRTMDNDLRVLEKLDQDITNQPETVVELNDVKDVEKALDIMINEVNQVKKVFDNVEKIMGDVKYGRVATDQVERYNSYIQDSQKYVFQIFSRLPQQARFVAGKLAEIHKKVLSLAQKSKMDKDLINDKVERLNKLLQDTVTADKIIGRLTNAVERKQEAFAKLEQFEQQLAAGRASSISYKSINYKKGIENIANYEKKFRDKLLQEKEKIEKLEKPLVFADQHVKEIKKLVGKIDKIVSEQEKAVKGVERLDSELQQKVHDVASKPEKKGVELVLKKLQEMKKKTLSDQRSILALGPLDEQINILIESVEHTGKQIEKEYIDENKIIGDIIKEEAKFHKQNESFIKEAISQLGKDMTTGEAKEFEFSNQNNFIKQRLRS